MHCILAERGVASRDYTEVAKKEIKSEQTKGTVPELCNQAVGLNLSSEGFLILDIETTRVSDPLPGFERNRDIETVREKRGPKRGKGAT